MGCDFFLPLIRLPHVLNLGGCNPAGNNPFFPFPLGCPQGLTFSVDGAFMMDPIFQSVKGKSGSQGPNPLGSGSDS